MRKSVLLLSATAMIAACSQAKDTDADSAAIADPGGHGAVLVDLSDGRKILNVSTADGVSYGGVIEQEPGTWSVEGDKNCIDPAGEEPKFCFVNSPAQEDGSWTNTNDNGEVVRVRRIGEAAAEAPEQVGSYMVTFADGGTGLVVWTSDHRSYFAPSAQRGTWRVADGRRCGTPDGESEETCSTPGAIAADGSWTATPDDPELGPVTVTPLG